jgi:hypothetical protein
MTDPAARLAELLGTPVRPEHLEEVERAWRLMAPHRDRVRAAALADQDEPAPVFRP